MGLKAFLNILEGKMSYLQVQKLLLHVLIAYSMKGKILNTLNKRISLKGRNGSESEFNIPKCPL